MEQTGFVFAFFFSYKIFFLNSWIVLFWFIKRLKSIALHLEATENVYWRLKKNHKEAH